MPSITIVAIMKDEGEYLLEWVSYYRLVGAASVIIYDNGSSDGSLDMAQKLAAQGIISLVDWSAPPPGQSPQVSAYNHALAGLKPEDWVAFVDADEFILPLKRDDLSSALEDILVLSDEPVDAIAMNWKTFGSAGQKTRQPGLVISRFKRCAVGGKRPNNCFKTLARVGALKSMHIHLGELKSGAYVNDVAQPVDIYGNGMTRSVSHENLQVNHYMVKSLEEFQNKKRRGNANYPPEHQAKYERFNEQYFRDFDVNEGEDRGMERLSTQVASEMKDLLESINEFD